MSAETTTTTAMASSPVPKLTEEMRLATKSAHSFSQSAVNAKLLVSFTNRKVYGQAVLLFYYIYAQIELSMRSQKENPLFKDVLQACEKLHRSDAFVKDVDFYLEQGWDKKYGPPPAVVAYVNRIKELEKEDPILLIPYAYHMYITLLSGGPYIKKMVVRAFSLPDANGAQIFEFDSKSLMALRNPLKDAVDALTMDVETKKRFLAESLRVFQSNNEVVKGIEGMGRQFALWVLKWVIVIQLIYWTFVLFVQGKPSIA